MDKDENQIFFVKEWRVVFHNSKFDYPILFVLRVVRLPVPVLPPLQEFVNSQWQPAKYKRN